MSNLWNVEPDQAPRSVDGTLLTARGQRTRAKILAAAQDVFADRTYLDASIVKITEAAGIAQGTFYLYFESKEQVFGEVVRDLNHRVRRAMSKGAAQGSTRSQQERLGFRGYFEFVAQNPGMYMIMRQAEIFAPALLKEHYARISAGYVKGLQEAMDTGEITPGNPEVMSWILMGIGEIVGARWVLWEDSKSVSDEVFEEVLRFVNAGLGAKEHT